MRGAGRVFQPKVRGRKTAIWWCDFTLRNCTCGTCDASGRHREPSGTADYTEALGILAQRREARRIGRPVTTHERPVSTALWPYTLDYIVRKAGKISDRWLDNTWRHLERAAEFFGPEMPLAAVKPSDVRKWDEALHAAGLSGGPRRHHLNTLSNLYRYAQEDEAVATGYNPVAALTDKPQARKRERDFFEVAEAALFLDAARRYAPKRDDLAVTFGAELVAALLLTGGRPAEVLALDISDVNFERETLRLRGTKTEGADRVIPLFPQLARILRRHIGTRTAGLLFPCPRTGRPLTDIRKLLAGIAAVAGLTQHITPYVFRHTFCAAALQITDHGAPVSAYTVAKWLGHGGDALVKRIYGHLGTLRVRGSVVEYPTERLTLKAGKKMFAVRAANIESRKIA